MKKNYQEFSEACETNFDEYIDNFVDEFIDEIGEEIHDMSMYQIRFNGDDDRTISWGSIHFFMGVRKSSRLFVNFDGYAEIAEFPIPKELEPYILEAL